jgi:hypothetical protein
MFHEGFIERIKRMYENAISSIPVHGHLLGPIPIVLCPARMPNEHVALQATPDSSTQNPGTKTIRHPDWVVNPQDQGGGLCGRHFL